MSEPVTLAKAAREKLAAALSALQSQDDVPSDLLEAAEPIAQAMSVLHRIERTGGANLEGRDGALAAVRTALDRLQKIAGAHPAVDAVMEAVAGSLSKVHALARYQPPAQPVIAPQPVVQVTQPIAQVTQPIAQVTQPIAQVTQPIAQPAPQPFAAHTTLPVATGQPAPSPTYQAQPQPAPQPAYQPAPQPVYQPAPQPAYQPAPQPVYQPAPQPAYQPAPQPAYQPAPQPAYQAPAQPAHQPAPQPQPARPIPAERPSQPRGAMPSVDVELGIHSASNFYKGLGGNDVIEHGGIFVATYKVLKIGTPVSLHVHLPGDYEFQASGVVQWTREGGTSEPGFGARLTQITPDGRQLVYRYTRNREPMFYDDL